MARKTQLFLENYFSQVTGKKNIIDQTYAFLKLRCILIYKVVTSINVLNKKQYTQGPEMCNFFLNILLICIVVNLPR